jgi:transmembrane sensor
MKNNTKIPTTSTSLEEFLDRQKNLDPFEKKLEAGVLVSEIDNINLNKAYAAVHRRIEKKGSVIQLMTRLTRVAAVLTIPMLLLTIWSLFLREESVQYAKTELTWYEVQSPAGMRSQVILPDGTRMWLNAESKIRYSIPFTREYRTVELTGEAYLEVEKNDTSPFLVQSGKSSVEVTGTQFNIKAYPDEDQVEIALRKGSVKFAFQKNNNRKHYLNLKPGDYLVFDRDDEIVQLTNTELDKYIAWHTNTLILDDTPMEEVARLLERWYGVDVTLVGQALKKYRFTTTFENESLFQVIELLKLSSPINIKYVPGKINRETGITERSKVIISKK